MNLWHLYPNPHRPHLGVRGKDPWEPWYDKAFEFVIRAETEGDARRIAAGNGGDERREVWTSPSQSICEELTAEGEAELIVRDLQSA